MRTLPSPGWFGLDRTVAACLGAYFGVRVCQVVIGPVIPGVIETYGVSRSAVGVALTGMWVAYALVQLPSGVLADRFGERRVVTGALVATGLATLGLGSAPYFAGFATAVVVLGVGAGIYYNPATTLLARTADDVGGSVGVHRIGGKAAGVVAPAGATAVGAWYGWRGSVASAAATVALVAVLFLAATRGVGRSRRAESSQKTVSLRRVLGLLNRSHTRVTVFMMAAVEFVGLAAMLFLPVALVEHNGLSEGAANLLLSAFFTVAATAQPVAGWLSDRHGRDRTAAALVGVGALGYGGLAAGLPTYFAVVPVVLAGVSSGATPVIQSRMLDGLSHDERGAGFGVFRTLYLLAGATGTAVVGGVADLAGWGSAFALLAGFLLAVLVTALAAQTTDGGAAEPPGDAKDNP